MKNINLILAASALLGLLSACNKNEVPQPGASSSLQKAIAFDAPYLSATKTAAQTDPIANFGAFAYKTTGDWSVSAVPNFMFNQLVTGNSAGVYTYSPVKYWPSGENEKVSFLAYAPYGTTANGISVVTANTDAGYPKIRYSVPSNEANQVDLIHAAPDLNLKASDGSVNLSFSHALARIGLHAQIGTSGWNPSESDIYINEVIVSGKFPSSGVMEVGTGTWSEVSNSTVRSYRRFFGNGNQGFRLTINRLRLSGTDGFIMVIPANSIETNIQVRYTVITKDTALPGGQYSSEYTCTNKCTISYAAGKSYEFALVANPSAISFGAPDVTDWVETSGGTETIPFS